MPLIGSLQTFDPTSDNFGDWVKIFDAFLVANELGEKEEARCRAMFIAGIGISTYSTLANLLSPKDPMEHPLHKLISTLLNHFKPTSESSAKQSQFVNSCLQPTPSSEIDKQVNKKNRKTTHAHQKKDTLQKSFNSNGIPESDKKYKVQSRCLYGRQQKIDDDNPIMLFVWINNQQHEMELDTGAEKGMLSLDFWEELGYPNLFPTKFKFCTYTEEVFHPVGDLKCRITYNGITITHRIPIVNGPSLFGRDLIRLFKLPCFNVSRGSKGDQHTLKAQRRLNSNDYIRQNSRSSVKQTQQHCDVDLNQLIPQIGFRIGGMVWFQTFSRRFPTWSLGTITQIHGQGRYLLLFRRKKYKRNFNQLLDASAHRDPNLYDEVQGYEDQNVENEEAPGWQDANVYDEEPCGWESECEEMWYESKHKYETAKQKL